MEGESQQQAGEMGIQRVVRAGSQLRVVYASDEELANHESRLDLVQKERRKLLVACLIATKMN